MSHVHFVSSKEVHLGPKFVLMQNLREEYLVAVVFEQGRLKAGEYSFISETP